MIIRLKKEYLTELNDTELATYIVTIALCQRQTKNYVCINNIMYALYGDPKRRTQCRNRHTSAISSLLKNGYLQGEKADSSGHTIDVPAYEDWEYFTSIGSAELQPIFSSNYNNKLAMLRVLATVLMCRSKRTGYKVCDVSLSLLCKETGKSQSTVQRALDNLVELGVLHKAKICDHRANVYGLAIDQKAVDKYAQTNKKRIGRNSPTSSSARKTTPGATPGTDFATPPGAEVSNPSTDYDRLATDNDYFRLFGEYTDAMWNAHHALTKDGHKPTYGELLDYTRTN